MVGFGSISLQLVQLRFGRFCQLAVVDYIFEFTSSSVGKEYFDTINISLYGVGYVSETISVISFSDKKV